MWFYGRMFGISMQGQEIIKSETNEREIIKLTPNQGPTFICLLWFLIVTPNMPLTKQLSLWVTDVL